MFTIRKEQIEVFRAPALKAYEDRMIAHLCRCFPTKCQAQSEADLREMIRHGVRTAAKYGFTTERHVCKYIDLMMVYGQEFADDPELPWARAILHDKTQAAPGIIMDRLYNEAKRNYRNPA
ncbi:MAG: hypothetical protein ACRD5K_19575 [Candidatus Acidiferrales bacterium]